MFRKSNLAHENHKCLSTYGTLGSCCAQCVSDTRCLAFAETRPRTSCIDDVCVRCYMFSMKINLFKTISFCFSNSSAIERYGPDLTCSVQSVNECAIEYRIYEYGMHDARAARALLHSNATATKLNSFFIDMMFFSFTGFRNQPEPQCGRVAANRANRIKSELGKRVNAFKMLITLQLVN